MTTPGAPEPRAGTPAGPDADSGALATPEQEAAAQAALAALPAASMPDAVWRRLEDAFAAEPALVGTAPADLPAADVAPVVPLSQAPSRRRSPGAVLGMLAGAAAAVVALVVGVQVLRPAAESGDLATGGSAASEASTAPQLPGTTKGGAYAAAPAMLATGTEYRDDQLTQQVGSVVGSGSPLADQASPQAPAPTAGAATGKAPRAATDGDLAGTFAASTPGVDACLSELRAGVTWSAVLVVDLATYEGREAALIVVGAPGLNPVRRVVDVWVVGRGCGPGHSQYIAVKHLTLP